MARGAVVAGTPRKCQVAKKEMKRKSNLSDYKMSRAHCEVLLNEAKEKSRVSMIVHDIVVVYWRIHNVRRVSRSSPVSSSFAYP